MLSQTTVNLSDFNLAFIAFPFAGIALDQPIVTSCGTGVTACILAMVILSFPLTHIYY